MTLLEAGSASAVALGLACFALIVIAGVSAGLGLLARLVIPGGPAGRLLLAPFAATVAWALAGNLLVRVGFSMSQVTPFLWLATLAFSVVGIRSLARLHLRPAVVAALIVVPLAMTLALAQTYFARGLTAHVGSPNFDTVNYTVLATAFWRYGLDTVSARSAYFQNLEPLLSSLGPARNHTYVLLAFFSPLVRSGEAILVRNLFMCWSLFVLVCSFAFYRSSWRGDVDEQHARQSWWTIWCYAGLAAGIGWAAVPAMVGNWDNALFVSVGPVLAALAGMKMQGWAQPLLLGTAAAYGAYTYPELLPFLGLFLLPFFLYPLRDPITRAERMRGYLIALVTATSLLSVGVRPIFAFFWGQLHATRIPGKIRPGGAFAQGLAETPLDPAAWWALGAEHGPVPHWILLSTLAGLLTAFAAAGVWSLWRRQRWAELSSLGFAGAAVGYFVLVDHYGYAAYKILSFSWWLIGLCLSEGTIRVMSLVRAGGSSRWPRRTLQWTTVSAIAFVLAFCLVLGYRQREIYTPDAVFLRQPTVAALVRLEQAAMKQPSLDALVMEPLSDSLVLPWVFYALKDTPVHAYQAANVTLPVPGGKRWASEDNLPAHVLIQPRPDDHTPARFMTPEFALVSLHSAAFVEHLDNPNGIEAWGTWLGDKAMSISVLSAPRIPVSLSFLAGPGPGRPETPKRTLELRSGVRVLGKIEINQPGFTNVTFPFIAAGGREVLTLSTPDEVTLTHMPNGDTRPLLVNIRDITVAVGHPQ